VTETWRPVDGFPAYEVSSEGRVRRAGRILKQTPSSNGYLRVFLCVHSKYSTRYTHRLVLAAFIGQPQPGMQGNHRNGRKDDNRLENLEYVTPVENSQHAYDTGLTPLTKKKRQVCKRGHLKTQRVAAQTKHGTRIYFRCRECHAARMRAARRGE